VLAGCGAREEETESPHAAPPPSAVATRLETYRDLDVDEGTVRERIVVETPGGLVVLVTGSRGDRLCAAVDLTYDLAGMRNGTYCNVESRPLTVVAFGGETPDAVDWTTLVGLVQPDVGSAEVAVADGRPEPARLHDYPDLTVQGVSWNGRIRDAEAATLTTYDRAGRRLATHDLGSLVRNQCEHDPSPGCGIDERGNPEPWFDLVDPYIPTAEEELSDAQREGLAIFRADPRARALLGRRSWHVSEYQDVGVTWSTCETDASGTVVMVDIEQPLDVARFDWPLFVDECDGKPYRVVERCHRVENVTSLEISVDLATKRIVEIKPLGDDVVVDGTPLGDLPQLARVPAGC
jgi:hypothetical protein